MHRLIVIVPLLEHVERGSGGDAECEPGAGREIRLGELEKDILNLSTDWELSC